ncbi:MAG TPA: tetratricopeptide repeat protein [Pantanalinema sp.]
MHPKALAHHQEGLAFQEQGDLGAAKAAFLEALSLDARLSEARLGLAEVLTGTGDLVGAADACKTLLSNQPNHVKASFLCGVLLTKLKQYAEAAPHLQRVLFLEPGHLGALRALSSLYRDAGDVALEAEMLARLCASLPKDAALRFDLADRLVKLGKVAEAVAPLRDALAMQPGHLPGYLLLAGIEGRLGRGEEAWKILQSVAGRSPEAPGLRESLLALCRSQAASAAQGNRAAEASHWWERLLAISPDDPEALAHLERLYTTTSRMGDLVRLLEGFAHQNPTDSAAVTRLAEALFSLGRKRDALTLFKEALKRNPEDERLRTRALDAAMELGDASEARTLTLMGRDPSILPAAERLRFAKAKAMEGQREEAWVLFEGLLEDPDHGPEARALGRNLAVRQAEDHLDNPVLALKWSERALSCNPTDESVARQAALLYRQLQRGADAVRVLRVLPNRYKDHELLRELAAACDVADLHEEGHEAYTALAAREGDSPELILRLVGHSVGAKKLERAWSECDRLQRLDPSFSKLRPTQARVAALIAQDFEDKGQYASAVEWWKRHMALEPDSPHRKRLAEAQIAIGDLNAAVLTYRAWFRRHPTDLEVALWLGRNELEEGLYSEAREYFEAVLELRPNNLEAMQGLAKVATGEGSDDEALRLFNRILALEKDHLPATIGLIEQALRSGDLQKAREVLERLLAQNPDHPEARRAGVAVYKGLAGFAAGSEAKGHWEAVLALDPEDPDALKALARAITQRPDAPPAMVAQAYSEVLAHAPDDPDAQAYLARQAFERGERGEAKRLLAPSAVRETPAGRLLCAEIAHDERRDSEAWDLLRALDPETANSPRARTLFGDVARRLAQTQPGPEAIALYRELLRHDPDDLEAYHSLADRLAEAGDTSEAVSWLKKLLLRDPSDPRATLKAAALHSQRGASDEALRLLLPLVAEGNADALAASAGIHLEAGDRAQAREAYERILSIAPQDRSARKALAELAAQEADGPLAWSHLRALIEAFPQDAGLRSEGERLLQGLVDRLDPREAIAWYEEVNAVLGESIEVSVTYAGLLRRVGEARQAAEVLEGVLERAPYRRDVAMELGEHHLAEGRLDRARAAYGIAAQSGDPAALRALGAISRQEGDLPQATAWLEKALLQVPDDPALAMEVAETACEAGDARKAREQLEKVLSHQPDHPRARTLLAMARREIARSATGQEALEAWSALSKADPADAEAHRETLRAAEQLGDEAAAELALERLVAADPQDAERAFSLAARHHANSRFDEARALFARAAEAGILEAHWYLADLAVRAGMPDEARAQLERYGQSDSRALETRAAIARAEGDAEGEWQALFDRQAPDRRERLLALVRRLLTRTPPAEAIQWAARGFALTPLPGELSAQAVAALGFFHQSQGRHREALAAFEWAAAAGESAAMAALARRAVQEKDLDRAAAWLSRAVDLRPDDERLSLELAELHLQRNDPNAALSVLEGFLSLHPEHASAQALWERSAREGRPEALLAAAETHLSAGRGALCARLLDLYCDAVPAQATGQRVLTARYGLSRLAGDRQDQWEALEALAPLLAPHDAPTLRMIRLGLCWSELVDENFEPWLDRARALDPAEEELPAAAHLMIGELSLLTDRRDEARMAFLAAAGQGEGRAFAALARMAEEDGDVVEARVWYRKARKLLNEDPSLVIAHAKSLAESGELREANAQLDDLLDDHPALAPALLLQIEIVRSLAYETDGEEALGWYSKLARLAPDDAVSLRQVVRLATLLDRQGQVVEALEQLVSVDPQDAVSALALGLHRLAEGEALDARELLARASEADLPEAHLPLAELYLEEGDAEGAARCLEADARHAPESPRRLRAELALARTTRDPDRYWNTLEALAAEDPARWDEARREAEAALEQAPDDALALRTLSRLARREGQAAEALAALECYLAEQPLDATARLDRAELLEALDRRGEAYAALEGLDPAQPGAAELEQRLARAQGRTAQAEDRQAEAYGWWRRVLALAPDDREAMRAIADLLGAMGRSSEALPMLFGLAKDASDPVDPQRLAEALLAQRRTVEARAILQSLVREWDHMPAWSALCELSLELGELDEAWQAAERLLLDRAPGADALALRVLGAKARALDPAATPEAAASAWQAVLERQPADPEARFGLARALAASSRTREAIALLEGLLAEGQGTGRLKALLAECCTAVGDAKRAEALYAELLDAHPDNPTALMALARAAQARGEFVEAATYCERVLAQAPDEESPRARVLLAYCARQLAEAARLRRDFEEAFLFEEVLSAHQAPSLDLLRFSAELARDAGYLATAAWRYRRLLLAYPDALEEALQLARCYPTPDEGRAALEALWGERQVVAAAHALAMEARDQGEAERAIAWWDRALSIAPEHPVFLRRAADLCRREERAAEACAYYRRLSAVVGDDPALLKTWGAVALLGERWADAQEPFLRLANDHADREAACTLSLIAARTGDHQGAWDWAQRVLELGEHPQAEALAEEAARALAEEASDPQAAVAWRLKVLELAPADVEGWLSLGRARVAAGDLEAALETFWHAHELAPYEVGPLLERAATLRRMGDPASAKAAYAEVLAEDPRHAPSLFALAEMAWEEDDVQTVWELGQQLLALDNRDPSAMSLIGRCARRLAGEATDAQDWENAILYWELLLSFTHDEADALENLGEAYVQAGRFAEAVGIHRELVRLSPEDLSVKYRHGEIAAMGGFWDEARQCFAELLSTDPGHLASYHALALVALGLDDPQAAAEHYRAALGVDPNDLVSLFGLGGLLYSEERFEEAYPPLKRAAELSRDESDHADYLAMARRCAERLAEACAARGAHDEAVRYRQEAVLLDPQDASTHRDLARTLHEAGRKAAAIDALTALLKADPNEAEATFLLGEIHREGGDLVGAEHLYEGVVRTAPLHVGARLALAELAAQARDYDRAWEHLQVAHRFEPRDERVQALHRKLTGAFAERHQGDGDFAGAIRWWQRAFEEDPHDTQLLRKIARAQVSIAHLSAAAETYGKILEADPKDLEIAHILADIHRQRGDLRSAEGALLRIVALDPRHLPSLRALMLLAKERQNPPEALKRAYDLLDVEPLNTEALMLLAWSHEQMLERRAALEAAREIVAIDPQHAEAYHLMGRLARDLGDVDLAKKALTSAIYHQPRAPYYHTMGTIYQALGQTDEALAAFGQALVLDPECADAHADLGLGLMRKAQPDKAKPHLQRAFALTPQDTERSLALQCALDLIG